MQEIKVRRAQIEDYDAIEIIMKQVQQMHIEWRPDLYKMGSVVLPYEMYEAAVAEGTFIVAEMNNNVVGFLAYELRHIENDNQVGRNVLFIDSMGVDEAFRGKGIGHLLFEYVKNLKQNRKIDKIELQVNAKNVRAREMYEKCGFAEKAIVMELACSSMSNKLPTRQQAEALLQEAEISNPGPWGKHSRVAAACAEKIAALCEGMDAEKAYILGLLHDIGRKFGVKHLGHVYDGYMYMLELGYEEVARICLTHSFSVPDISCYIGNFDITEGQQNLINDALHTCEYDDYDRLIQLCDCLAGAEGVMNMEERMADVKRRYGNYPQDKWDMNMYLKALFEEKAGKDIYEIVG